MKYKGGPIDPSPEKLPLKSPALLGLRVNSELKVNYDIIRELRKSETILDSVP